MAMPYTYWVTPASEQEKAFEKSMDAMAGRRLGGVADLD
jgi:hypothetical protein